MSFETVSAESRTYGPTSRLITLTFQRTAFPHSSLPHQTTVSANQSDVKSQLKHNPPPPRTPISASVCLALCAYAIRWQSWKNAIAQATCAV